MKKYLLTIACYNDYRQKFFEEITSKRNKEFCEIQGYEYIEIKEIFNFRKNLMWEKLFNIKKLLDEGEVKDGDHITAIDADMCIVDSRFPLWSEKPFTYAIDSCNTHCMGYYSIKVCDWSRKLIENILDEDNYKKHGEGEFWDMWAEQASFYYIAGILEHTREHNDISMLDMENYGYGSKNRPETIYSPEELLKNIEIKDVHYNVTCVHSNIDPHYNILDPYYKIHNEFDKTIIRHWAAWQPWNEKYFNIPIKK